MHSRLVALALPVTLVSACEVNMPGVKVINNPPNAEILSPSSGDTLRAGEVISFVGKGSDADSVETELTATWMVDSDTLCEPAALDVDGFSNCSVILEEGSYNITLTVIDPMGDSLSDQISIVVIPSNAPSVEILAPVASGVYYADRNTTFEGIVSDEETPAADLVVSWKSSVQGELGLPANPSDAGQTGGSALLAMGEHEIVLSATDADGLTASAAVNIRVVDTNHAPSCGVTSPVDGSYDVGGASVTLEGFGTDEDVDASFLTAIWSSDRDGDLVEEGLTASGITSYMTDTLSIGTHQLTLTIVDEVGESCSDTITYTVGSPPSVAITAPGDGEVVNEGELVTFVGVATDEEDVGVDVSIQWSSSLDGTLDTTPPPGDGTGAVGFGTDELSVGEHTIRLRATDSDDLYADDTITLIVNDLPSSPTIAISPTSPLTADDLTASVTVPSTDAEGHSISYSYVWTQDGVSTSYLSSVVPASATARGQVWEVTVTPFDGYGAGDAAVRSVTIGNTPPVVSAAPTLGPDPVREGGTLTCTAGLTSDADGDTVTSTIGWYVNGGAVAATGTTLGSTYWAAGDSVYCVQTPNDGIVSGTGVSSNVVVITNTAPTVSAVGITPDPATAASTLTCGYTYADIDGDADSSIISWTINGSAAGTGATLSGGFVRGDVVSCSVTPFDGTDSGTAASDSITISNAKPVVSSVSLTPSPAYTDSTLSCAVAASSDADGDTLTYTYAWYVNSATVGVTSSSLSGSYFNRGDNVYCVVTPNDGYESGTGTASSALTISNSAPVITSVTLSPTSPGTDTTLAALVNASDADGDTISYSYAWYVGSTLVVTTTSGSLPGAYFVRGDSVYVVVTPSDGATSGSAYTSSSVTVVNTLPTAPTVAFSPAAPEQELDDIVCYVSAASTDADGDAISYTFTWSVDGVPYTGATTTTYTGDTVPAADTALGFDWICTATPSDGYGSGTGGTKLVTVIDVLAPGAPTLTTPTRFRNEDDMTVTGTCTYGDCEDVTIECSSALVSKSSTVTCGSAGTFSSSFTGLERDETTLCTAYCTDAAGNDSPDSNTISTDVCEPFDAYEDAAGTGDSVAAALDLWPVLADDGLSNYTVEANVLGTDTEDWYVVDTTDNVAADRAALINYYSFDARLLDPSTGLESTVYTMMVYRNSTTAASCSTTSGYTAYTDYVYDRGEAKHAPAADRRYCAAASALRNFCEDMGATYYIKVSRVSSSVTSCAGYELSLTNNGGVCSTSECPH